MLEFGLARQMMQIGDMGASFFEHIYLVFAETLGGFDSPSTG